MWGDGEYIKSLWIFTFGVYTLIKNTKNSRFNDELKILQGEHKKAIWNP